MSEHVLERLSAYLDGELPRDEQATVHEHLGACADCALRLEELATLDAAARALPIAAPAGYFEALPARLRARLEPKRRTPRLPLWGLAIAAALVLGVLTPAVLRRTQSPADAPVQRQEPSAAAPRERNAGSLELRDGGLSGRVAPPNAEPAAPAVAPVRPRATLAVPPEKAGDAAPTEVTRRRQETAPGAASAPMATAPPPAPAPRAPAHVLEQSQVREEKADEADSPRDAATDLQAARPQAAGEGEDRRTALGAASKLRASPSAADSRYARLLARSSPGDAYEARELRDAWRAFARDHPAHAGADEARVRALEAGAQLYLFSLDPRELESVRADAAAYLARPDAAQPERVRALLRPLER